MGWEQPCCWQSCPLLLLNKGLVHSSTGSSTLEMQENQIQLQRDYVAVAIATYLQTSSAKAEGVPGASCGNTAWFVPWQP